MISLPNCPITRQETDNQSHLRKLRYLRFKIYVALYSNHTKTIIEHFATNLHNHKTQQWEREFHLLMLDTGIVYKHRENRNKNTQYQSDAKQIMIPNNNSPLPPPPSPSHLQKKRSKIAADASNSFHVPGKTSQTLLFASDCIVQTEDYYKMFNAHCYNR